MIGCSLINKYMRLFLFLDIAYAEIGLQGSKLKTFYAVYNEIKNELPPPVLLVYLNCDAETELKRIHNRGRDVKKSIDLKFLDTLNKAVERKVANAGKEINVISIDSAQKNFADDESAKKESTDLVFKFLVQDFGLIRDTESVQKLI